MTFNSEWKWNCNFCSVQIHSCHVHNYIILDFLVRMRSLTVRSPKMIITILTLTLTFTLGPLLCLLLSNREANPVQSDKSGNAMLRWQTKIFHANQSLRGNSGGYSQGRAICPSVFYPFVISLLPSLSPSFSTLPSSPTALQSILLPSFPLVYLACMLTSLFSCSLHPGLLTRFFHFTYPCFIASCLPSLHPFLHVSPFLPPITYHLPLSLSLFLPPITYHLPLP